MNCIDWYGAKQYCEWIGGRLPTEEEWEYAATHDGTQHLNTKYAFGDELKHCVNANYYDSSKQSYCDGTKEIEGSYVGTSSVGTYSPAGDSPLGLVDMTGNVWEWTRSLYTDKSTYYTLKGGSWDYYVSEDVDYLSVSYRGIDSPGSGLNGWGFRCAKDK